MGGERNPVKELRLTTRALYVLAIAYVVIAFPMAVLVGLGFSILCASAFLALIVVAVSTEDIGSSVQELSDRLDKLQTSVDELKHQKDGNTTQGEAPT